MRFQFIADYCGDLTHSRLCQVMGVTARRFRALRQRLLWHHQRRDIGILTHIRDQHRLSLSSYGRPRMTEALNELGLHGERAEPEGNRTGP